MSVRKLTLAVLFIVAGCNGSDDGRRDGGQDAWDGDGGGMVICTNAADCQAEEKCLEGICRPADYCLANEHCDVGYYCNQLTNQCTEAECVEDQNCGVGYVCIESFCHSICEDVTCDPGDYCVPETGECEPMPCTISTQSCETDSDCPAERYCDPIAFGCTECPTDFFCNIHTCFPVFMECERHEDCTGDNERCNLDSHRCEPYPDVCASDKDCQPKYCNLFTQTCQDEPFTGECTSDEDCHRLVGPEYYCHPRLHNCVLPFGPGECYDTADCADPNLICDLKTNTCVERGTICGVDSDCDPDYECIEGICIWVCQVPCQLDDECASGQVCHNQCCMLDLSCDYDWDCTPPEECMNGWCTIPIPCTDDSREDNDDTATATQLPFPPLNQVEDHTGLVICYLDDDWYKIDVTAGATLKVTIHFSHSFGDLDMRLYDNPAATTAVDSSTSVSDVEEVFLEEPRTVDTTFYVKVYGFSGAEGQYYLQVAHGEPGTNPCSPDDNFEENDAWTTATQLTLPAGGNADDYPGLILCANDEDFYTIDVPANEALRVSITFTNSQGDLDLKLLDTDLYTVDTSATSDDIEEVSVRRVAVDTTFFIKVYGWSGAQNGYFMRVENPGGINVDCTDGGNEPNESAVEATVVSAGNYSGLFICMSDPQDRDWYKITVPAGGRLHARIDFENEDGDLNLYLYESDGTTLVDESTWIYDDYAEVDGPRVLADTSYRLKVSAATLDFDTPYTMSLVIDPPIDCTDGGYEPNDTAAQATDLPAGDYSGLYICDTDPRDEDWYRIQLADGERMFASVAFTSTDADIDLALYREDGTTLVDSSYYSNPEEVESGRVPTATAFLLKVRAYSINDDAAYDLSVVIEPPIQCTDDIMEPNDDMASATQMVAPGTGSLVLCPADADFFEITAARGDIITVTLINDSSTGDLDLYLYDADGLELDYSTSWGTVEEDVTHDVYAGGSYFVEVVPKDQDAEDIVDYHMTMEVDGFTPCDDDTCEPNDTRPQATVLTDLPFSQVGSDWVLEILDLQICRPGPLDWYAFDLEQGAEFKILVRFSHADGDIDITFYRPDGTFLADSTSASDNEEIIFEGSNLIPETGRFTLKVFPYYSFTGLTTYDLVITSDRPFQ